MFGFSIINLAMISRLPATYINKRTGQEEQGGDLSFLTQWLCRLSQVRFAGPSNDYLMPEY